MDTNEVKKEIHDYGETHLSPERINKYKSSNFIISKRLWRFYHDQGQKVKFKIG